MANLRGNDQSGWIDRLGKYGLLLFLGLAGYKAYFEIAGYFALKHQREFITYAVWRNIYYAFVAVLALGIVFGLLAVVFPTLIKRHPAPAWLQWGLAALILIADAWFFLYAPWQRAYFGRWSQALLFLGSVLWIGLILNNSARLGWRELAALGLMHVYILTIFELRRWMPALTYRSTTVAGIPIVFGGLLALYGVWSVDALAKWIGARPISSRRILAMLLVGFPLFLLLAVGPENYFRLAFSRLSLCLMIAPFVILLLAQDVGRVRRSDWVLAVSLMAFCLIATAQLASTLYSRSYPFSLSWSEGNRFYDYSLIFASNIYDHQGKIAFPYFDPGRYSLWGLPFLIPGLPIFIHRLWNLVLQTGLPLILGWLSGSGIKDWRIRLGFTLAVYLFVLRAGVYAPLLISLIIVTVFLREPSLPKRLVAVAIASLYAGLSRQTWAPAPGIWAVLADLLIFYPKRSGGLLQRIWPALLLGLAGTIPGTIGNWEKIFGMVSGDSLVTKQPLLWYRLLPNSTYGYGILIGAAVLIGPLILVLGWLVLSRTWAMERLARAAIFAAGFAFFAAGIIISAKIGGGSNLHNLDMFCCTIILLGGIACARLEEDGKLKLETFPLWLRGVAAVSIFLSLITLFGRIPYSALPKQRDIDKSLYAIRQNVNYFKNKGDVLFMDQRQLITFGYIQDLPLVPEFEKGYLMDQAMASDAEYFKTYYQDLARKRFSLIVTEPQKLDRVNWGESEGSFPEENDLWVKWVSTPTLCFYEPIYTSKVTRIQLLVPRADVSACDAYLK